MRAIVSRSGQDPGAAFSHAMEEGLEKRARLRAVAAGICLAVLSFRADTARSTQLSIDSLPALQLSLETKALGLAAELPAEGAAEIEAPWASIASEESTDAASGRPADGFAALGELVDERPSGEVEELEDELAFLVDGVHAPLRLPAGGSGGRLTWMSDEILQFHQAVPAIRSPLNPGILRGEPNRRCGGPESHEFDFLLMRRRGVVSFGPSPTRAVITSQGYRVRGGCAVMEFTTVRGGGRTGELIRTLSYEPSSGKWMLRYIDSDGRLLESQEGRMRDRGVDFIGKRRVDGREVEVRTVWSGLERGRLRFVELLSPDGGVSWKLHMRADYRP